MDCPYCMKKDADGHSTPGEMREVEGTRTGDGIQVAVYRCLNCGQDVLAQAEQK